MQVSSLPVRVDTVAQPLVATLATSPADRLDTVLSDLVSRSAPGMHGDDTGMPSPGMPSPGDSLAAADSRAPSPVGSHVSGGAVLGGGVTVGLAYGMSVTPSVAASVAAASDTGDAESTRQDLQELRRHLAVLNNVQQAGTAEGMCAACDAIQSLVTEKHEAKQCAPAAFRLPGAVLSCANRAYVLYCTGRRTGQCLLASARRSSVAPCPNARQRRERTLSS